MFPSDFIPSLNTSSFFIKSKIVAGELLGTDMERDMDMVVEKFPFTNTPTPWHQDSAYWPKGMKDTRSLSCWLALDDATLDNGCMWYVPRSHMEATRKHNWAGNDEKNSYALVTECDESEGIACPITAGDMIVHDGRTLHYSRGNSTAKRRRALITNYRSEEMIKWERSIGYDHRNEKIDDNNVIS
jgi:ectoine hydroxylase-related dioxygenase (phytanoyl-CoA dioxygenase family)